MCCKHCLTPILLIFAIVLSVVAIKPTYSTTSSGPGGTIIEVDQGDVFLLRHTVTFNQPGERLRASAQLHANIWYTGMVQAGISPLNQPPIADFYFYPEQPRVGENVYFFDNSVDPDGYIVEWDWCYIFDMVLPIEFGNGQQNPIHTFDYATLYQIVLEVTDNGGARDHISRFIRILPPPPEHGVQVSISPGENNASPGDNVTFEVTVKNIGATDDNYLLENADNSGWSIQLENSVLEVPAGENRTTTLTITIPDNAVQGTVDNIFVTATSQTDNTVSGSDSCIARAAYWTGTTTFGLENLYKVGFGKDLQLYAGKKLVVKFYKYDNVTFQAESVIDNFVPPKTILENENVPHPRGEEGFSWGTVQIATLVLTTDDENEVISEIASFTVHQSHLRDRDKDILIAWGDRPELHDAFRAEVKDILIQWGGAPP